ncbi:MAG: PadR family transcriptional regulator [Myxococcota bacterium]
MKDDDGDKKFRSQLLKGSLELAVLLVLCTKDRYGLEIVEVLNATEGMRVSEGSIYPLLNRLRKEQKLESRWVERDKGHALKYYSLTPTGRRACRAMWGVWEAYTAAVAQLEGGRTR